MVDFKYAFTQLCKNLWIFKLITSLAVHTQVCIIYYLLPYNVFS